jgi:P-type E1-E2 ATPase
VSEEARPARDLSRLWLGTAVVGILVGAGLYAAGNRDAANVAWAITTAIGVVPMATGVVGGLIRREPGVDLIALIAMVSALLLGEYFAGAVIALMLASGEALEAYADRQAHKELSALLARAPRTVTRYEDGDLATRPIEEVLPGDRLLVKTGEVVPVDGIMAGDGVLDESALTGESRPVDRPYGDLVRSGALNAGPAFDLRATASAEESTYAGIVRLVKAAQVEKAPAVRLADRYATIFIPVTLVMAFGAWAISGDSLRFLSVVMVATPCPLILAVPIAIVAGISRSAKRGIIVKGGGALETLARAGNN